MDPRRPEDFQPRRKREKKDNSLRDSGMKLEKKDIPAIIISAALVFAPIFIVLVLIVIWALS